MSRVCVLPAMPPSAFCGFADGIGRAKTCQKETGGRETRLPGFSSTLKNLITYEILKTLQIYTFFYNVIYILIIFTSNVILYITVCI